MGISPFLHNPPTSLCFSSSLLVGFPRVLDDHHLHMPGQSSHGTLSTVYNMIKFWYTVLWLLSGCGRVALVQGQPTHKAQEDVSATRDAFSVTIPHAVERFRQRARLSDLWDPKVQEISQDARSFRIHGHKVHFEDLVPLDNLFSPNATGSVDGVEESLTIHIHQSLTYPDIHAVLDENGLLLRAYRLLTDGNIIDLVLIKDGTFVEIDSFVDLDPLAGLEFDAVSLDTVCTTSC